MEEKPRKQAVLYCYGSFCPIHVNHVRIASLLKH